MSRPPRLPRYPPARERIEEVPAGGMEKKTTREKPYAIREIGFSQMG
jgi:hypothetical protein